jgi:deoxycytidylate deaminase
VINAEKPLGPELFIALTSATGTDLAIVQRTLEQKFEEYKFQYKWIHLIELLYAIKKWSNLPQTPVDNRIDSHMNAGNEFRQAVKRGDAIALLGIGAVRKTRVESGSPTANDPVSRCAYLFRGLKNPAEEAALRAIYTQGFILIGVYSPHDVRLDQLTNQISESRHDSQVESHRSTAERLIYRDQEETGNEYGQNLRNTFYKSDVFVDASKPDVLRESLGRFIDLLFGYPFHTPSQDEYGMFHAQAAALRSADLGRQVGAAVATDEGDIIAVGTNEVPKAGGGLYWAGDKPDNRDFVLGFDSNDRRKRNLLADLLERLKKEKWLSSDKEKLEIDEAVKLMLSKSSKSLLRKSQLMNVIEFGRAVHAEMAALMDAARRGVSVKNATLYCTTFPCHLCARHIVAAGIRRVVYIEPYPKSLATQLYPDSIEAVSSDATSHQILFEPFVGVAPRQYMNLFAMQERKTADGTAISIDRQSALPRCQSSARTYMINEQRQLDTLNKIMRSKGLLGTAGGGPGHGREKGMARKSSK